MTNRRHGFLALWPRKQKNTLNKRKTNSLWHVTFKRWLGRTHLEVVKNLTIFFQKFWYSLIASPMSFTLIYGFRYLQFKPDALHCLYARHPWRYTVTLKIAMSVFFVTVNLKPQSASFGIVTGFSTLECSDKLDWGGDKNWSRVLPWICSLGLLKPFAL